MATPWRLFWLLVLACHAVASAGWCWLMPGGFPMAHPRFWSNRVVPIAVLAVIATAVWASRGRRFVLLRVALVAFPAAWASAAVAARLVFPITFERLFVLPLVGAALMGAAAWLTFRRQRPARRGPTLAVATMSTLIGATLPFTQRAPAPDTRPLNAPMLEVVAAPGPDERVLAAIPPSRLRVHPGDGSLTVQAGTMTVTIHPVLRFFSRSPDGCWTILAPLQMRIGPDLVLRSVLRQGNGLALHYRADYEAILQVDPGPEGGPIRLEATARLLQPVFSHLNSFCDLEVSGHRRLSLSFSPCPETLIEVRPADYPTGRPLRLAFRDAQGRFHVVEATSGEKGPFRELARGKLARSEPLAITLHDRGVAQARVVLEDWPAQAGTVLSPTAGWGVPVNAIEFTLIGDRPGSPAEIYITLAGTSVGRGWDSVGHGAGMYRNRMRIDIFGIRKTR